MRLSAARITGWAGRGRQRWLGLITVPLLVAALLMWATSGSTGRGGSAMAAVVNNDRPVTIQGQLVPLGRQLAGLLVDGPDEQFRWVLTSEADARRGLASGDYTALVVVPPSFSARATAAAAGNDPAKAAQGVVTVTTARDSALVDAAVARRVLEAATTSLNAQVVQTYLENVYLGFTTLHDELGKAADGASQLATGTRQARTGARQVSDGAVQLDHGSGTLATGARQLAAGTTQLSAGASQLSGGLADARRQTADLPGQTRQLAAGARQVADGNQQLAQTLVPLLDGVIKGIDAFSSLGTSVTRLAHIVSGCPRLFFRDFCASLNDASGAVSAGASQMSQSPAAAGSGTLRGKLVQLRDGMTALATGSRKVADATAQLADATPMLVGGIAQASTGARQLADGAGQVDTGAHQLADGARRLNTGSGQLAGGAGQLADGVSRINGGMITLADGLSSARTQIPSFTAAERTRLARAVATPTLATGRSTATTRLSGSLFLVLALWLGAVIAFASRHPLPPVLSSSRPTRNLAAAVVRPALAAASAAGAVLGLAMAAYLGLGIGRSLGLALICMLAAVAFVLVNQALAALAGGIGSAIGLLAALVTAITGITSTSPSTLASLARLLPADDAATAFRAMTMGGGGLPGAIAALVIWAVAGIAGTAWAIERRRTVPPRSLRPPTGSADVAAAGPVRETISSS